MDQAAIDKLKNQVAQSTAQQPLPVVSPSRAKFRDIFPLRYLLWGIAPMILLSLIAAGYLILGQQILRDRSEIDDPQLLPGIQLPLHSQDATVSGSLVINLLTEYQNGINVVGPATFEDLSATQITTDQITANNILYGVTVGAGLASTGGQTPTLTNTGVLSLQGQTGAVTFLAGSGISITDLTIANTDTGSGQNIFKTITVGSDSFSAGSNTDTLKFTAGSNITLSTDTTNKNITISNPGALRLMTASNGSGETESFSGLELSGSSSNEVSLLQGCSDDQVLRWSVSTSKWACANVAAGSSGDITAVGNVTDGAAFTTGGSGSSLFYHNSGFEGELTVTTLTSDQTYTLPDSTGTFCLSSGNCAGTAASIGGSGTTNFVPKFSSSYNLTDSSIFDNGNVGIGNTAPLVKLDVTGQVAIGNSVTSARLTTGSGPRSLSLIDTNANLRVWRYTGASNENPAVELVWGNNDTISNNSNEWWDMYLDNNSLNFRRRTGGSDIDMLVLDEAGMAGFGDTTPDAHLEVSANGTTGGSIFMLSSDDGNNGDLFTALENGNIGIGTTAPTGKLHVNGNANGKALVMLNELGDQDILTASVSGTTRLSISNSGQLKFHGVDYDITTATNEDFAVLPNGTGDIVFWTDSTNTQLFLDGSKTANLYSPASNQIKTDDTLIVMGNVGIGTTNPSGKLEIVGNSNTEQVIIRANSTQTNANPIFQLQNSSGTPLLSMTSDNSSNIFLGHEAGRVNAYNSGAGEGSNNNFIGYRSGYNNTTGSFNTAVGYQSMLTNTTGQQNTALGWYALGLNSTGNNNTAVGLYSLHFTTADANTAIGRASGLFTSTGTQNTYLGFSAGHYNQTGSYNTIVGGNAGVGTTNNSFSNNSILGHGAGYALTTGSNNLLLGYQAGNSLTTGASNILIGYDVDTPAATTSNFLNIGNTIYGDVSTGNVGIGTTAPGGIFDVTSSANNEVRLRMLTTDTTDAYSLNLSSSNGKRIYLTSEEGTNRTALGLSSTGNSSNSLFGVSYSADSGSTWSPGFILQRSGEFGIGTTGPGELLHISGASSPRIRVTDTTNNGNAGINFFEGGSTDEGFGIQYQGNGNRLELGAFNQSTTFTQRMVIERASGNVGIGTTAPTGLLNLTGAPVGKALAIFNETGNQAIFTASASGTTRFIIRNNGNVGIGDSNPSYKLAIQETADGSAPTMLSLYNPGTSAGTGATINLSTGGGACGWQIQGTNSLMSMGCGSLSPMAINIDTNGNIGIGKTNPSSEFDVNGTVRATAITIPTAGGTLSFSNSLNAKQITTGGNSHLALMPGGSGNVGIGTITPGAKLAISGLTTSAGTALVADGSGNVYLSSSSERYKTNISSLNADFSKLLELNPVSYNYTQTGAYDVGFIAEDLHSKGLTDLVIYDKYGRPDAIKYDRFPTYMIGLLKEQNNELNGLKNSLSNSDPRVSNLSVSVNALKQSLEDEKASVTKLSERIEKIEGLELLNITKLNSSTESAVIGDNLLVLGTTSLREASILESLAVGTTLQISPSSINTLELPLEIQPMKQAPVSIMAGAVTIETDGTVTFAENVEFAKNVDVKGSFTTQSISVPIDSITDHSDTLSHASGSAGTTFIKAGQTYRTISTPSVEQDSLVYITPLSDTNGQTPYVTDIIGNSGTQSASFTIKISSPIGRDLPVNFFIIKRAE